MKVEDVRIGDHIILPGENNDWIVVGKRQVKGTKAVPVRYTLRLAFDDGKVRGYATTRALGADEEMQVDPLYLSGQRAEADKEAK